MAAHTRPAGRPRHRRRTAIGAASLVTPDLGLELGQASTLSRCHPFPVPKTTKIFVFRPPSLSGRPCRALLPRESPPASAARPHARQPPPPSLALALHAPVRSLKVRERTIHVSHWPAQACKSFVYNVTFHWRFSKKERLSRNAVKILPALDSRLIDQGERENQREEEGGWRGPTWRRTAAPEEVESGPRG